MDNFDLRDPLTRIEEQQSDTILVLFSSESDHMPSHSYFQCLKTSGCHVSFRQEAISLILQGQYSCNLDIYTQYLAINYMDRFISWQEIPQSNPWVVRLLVIACISLAAKMKEIHFSFSDFQEMMLKCFNVMQEMVNNEVSESMVDVVSSSSTRTPISVLDCHCNKSESESTNSTMAATVTPERRELNGFCS
ncbi:D6-type cyclin isoform 5 [Hibiscus syriacus]|uniref:D6-type cyclin isoform 5 n=1 Tax=Hibiscus syriacus TaxID=106335 RepID=A0A6A3AUU4_HIBSY|nr:D6-type cyclin isoform 5 [Hibiscus syriacus]